jgi:hypothetical protein
MAEVLLRTVQQATRSTGELAGNLQKYGRNHALTDTQKHGQNYGCQPPIRLG